MLKYLKKQKPSIKIIYDAEALVCYREILKHRIMQRPLSQQYQKQLISKETSLFSIADAIYAVSPSEKNLIQKCSPNTPISIVSHSVESQQPTRSFHNRKDFLFVGRLSENDSPNVDSLLWFCQKVWPELKSTLPEATLNVVGFAEASQLQSIKNTPGIIFHGKQDCLKNFYDRARVFIAPTRFAAGIPLKVCEAVGQGLPTVMTQILWEQLEWPLYSDLAIDWQEPQKFIDCCVKIYTDENFWQAKSNNGLAYVGENFSPESLEQNITQSLRELHLLS